MVRNTPNSLRGSVSNMSLRTSRIDDENAAAMQARILELEAQVAAMSSREELDAADREILRQGRRRSLLNHKYANRTPIVPFGPAETQNQYEEAEEDVFTNYKRPNGILRRGPIPHSLGTQNDSDAATSSKSLNEHFEEKLAELRAKSRSQVVEHAKSIYDRRIASQELDTPRQSLITKGLVREGSALKTPEAYTQPFCDFMTQNPTVFHAVDYFENKLDNAGFQKVRLLHSTI
jgi:aminopeptidase I